MKSFASMDLFHPIQKALADQNYETPTPIQAKTIPPAIEGQDILGCAQTGTGKTAAFALPILDYIGNEKPPLIPNCPTVLVLAPTRELAIQISESFRVYGKKMKFRQALVYGGVGQTAQVKAVRRGVDVLIATPGRLVDLMEQGHINLAEIGIFVLDEADRMLDMGFLPSLKKIIADLPDDRQSLFFSATLPPKIRELAADLLFNPITVDVTPKVSSVKRIDQKVRIVKRANKVDSLHAILSRKTVDRAIVFTRTKHGASGLVKKLDRLGVRAVAIHGNKSQTARQKALASFRQKNVSVLVATDVAARGIDIDGVTHVINYDMPVEPESYVHRIGRTGRAGAEGIAISFCTGDEREKLRAIEKFIGQSLRIENPEERFETQEERPKKSGSYGHSNRKGRSQSQSGKPRNQTNKRFGRGKKVAKRSGKPKRSTAGSR